MMKVETWDEFYEAYPENRRNMAKERERECVRAAFRLYEKEGFADRYWSDEDDVRCYCGMPFEVIGRVPETKNGKPHADLSELPMWTIRFPNGDEIDAYPAEIVKSEMTEAGCPYWSEEYKKDTLERERHTIEPGVLRQMYDHFLERKYYNTYTAKDGTQDEAYSAGEIAEAEKWLKLFGVDTDYDAIQPELTAMKERKEKSR